MEEQKEGGWADQAQEGVGSVAVMHAISKTLPGPNPPTWGNMDLCSPVSTQIRVAPLWLLDFSLGQEY